MSDWAHKLSWIKRYRDKYLQLVPGAPTGQLSEIAETYWFYLRHCEPECAAARRAQGFTLLPEASQAWVYACAVALRELEPAMERSVSQSMAQQLWDADPLHFVDPYVMVRALDEICFSQQSRDQTFPNLDAEP